MVTLTRHVTERDIKLFAKASQDFNPVHLDNEAAKAGPFGKVIAHGMLGASLISAALAKGFPGALYLGQTLSFRKPVFIDDTITAIAMTITAVTKANGEIVTLNTRVVNQDGDIVITGEAMIKLPA